MLPSRSRPSSHVYTWNPRMHPRYFLFPPLFIQSICKFPCLHPLRASLISHFPPSPPYPIPVPTKPWSSVTWTLAIDPTVFPYCFLPFLLVIYFQHYNYSQSHWKKLELGRFSLSLKTPKGLAMSLRIKPPVLSMALGGPCDLAFPVSPVSFSITLLFVLNTTAPSTSTTLNVSCRHLPWGLCTCFSLCAMFWPWPLSLKSQLRCLSLLKHFPASPGWELFSLLWYKKHLLIF